MAHRAERISEALREELAEMIGYELHDPRLGSATVTGVQVSPDKRHALVRVRVEARIRTPLRTMAALEHAATFLRRELAAAPGLFRVPNCISKPMSPPRSADEWNTYQTHHKGRPRD